MVQMLGQATSRRQRPSQAPQSGSTQQQIVRGPPPPQIPVAGCEPVSERQPGPRLSLTARRTNRRVIKVRIQAEFMIAPKSEAYLRSNMITFMCNLAKEHNKQVPLPHPRMSEHVLKSDDGYDDNEWGVPIFHYLSQQSQDPRLPVQVRLISPYFDTSDHSKWRKDIEATWKYIREHFEIQSNSSFETRIHVKATPVYRTSESKKIAQAIIHFEPCWETLMSNDGEPYQPTRRNWRDNPRLGQANLTRAQSIDAIQASSPDTSVLNSVEPKRLIQAGKEDHNYSWWFNTLWRDSHRAIEYRNLPPIESAYDSIQRADLVVSFVKGAISCSSPGNLQRITPDNAGLRAFLSGCGLGTAYRQSNSARVAAVYARYQHEHRGI